MAATVAVTGEAAAMAVAEGTGEAGTVAAMAAAGTVVVVGTEAGHSGDTGVGAIVLGAIVLTTIRGPSPSDSAHGLGGRVTITIPGGLTIIRVTTTETLVTRTTIPTTTVPGTSTDLVSARRLDGQLLAVTPAPARSLVTDGGTISTSVISVGPLTRN